jgi:hypothetical protein
VKTRAKALTGWWTGIASLAAALGCLYEFLELAGTVGDAHEAAKDGVPYTAKDWAIFHSMERTANHWLVAGSLFLMFSAILLFLTIRARRLRAAH